MPNKKLTTCQKRKKNKGSQSLKKWRQSQFNKTVEDVVQRIVESTVTIANEENSEFENKPSTSIGTLPIEIQSVTDEREQHREELKQLEAERRKSKQNVPFQPTTSCSDFNSTEHVPHNENSSENVDMKSARKKERQEKYRELHREQLKQREAERRKSQKNVQQREYDSEEVIKNKIVL